MRRTLSFLLSVLLLAVALGLLLGTNLPNSRSDVPISFGVLDLTKESQSLRHPQSLQGSWAFYPGQIIDPNDGDAAFLAMEERRIHVPLAEALRDPMGGTLHLEVRTQEEGLLGLQGSGLPRGTKLYLNGRGMDTTRGTIDPRGQRTPFSLGFVYPNDGILTIVLQLPSGGAFLRAPDAVLSLGSMEVLNSRYDVSLMASSIAQFSFFLLGAHFLFTYFHSWKERYLLYFALFSLLQGVYYSTLNQGILLFILPTLREIPLLSVREGILTFSTSFLLLFVAHLFKKSTPLRWTQIYIGTMLGMGILLFLWQIFFPETFPMEKLYARMLHQTLIVLSYLRVFFVLGRALYRKEEGRFYLLPTLTAMTLLGGIFFLRAIYDVTLGHLPLFLLMVQSFTLALLANFRSVRSRERMNRMSLKLLTFDNIRQDFMQRTARELLRPILGVSQKVQQILEGRVGPMSLTQQETLLEVQRDTKRMGAIAEDLLNASSSTGHFKPVEVKPLSLGMVEDFIEEWRYMLPPGKPLRLLWEKPGAPVLVYGEEQRIRQILHHLMKNAVQYTASGTITVSVTAEKSEAVISIKDTGYGIRRENQEEVFQSFFKEDRKNVPNEDGLGLGLSIARNLAEEMEGRLVLTSEEGKGALLRLFLPLANVRLFLEKKEPRPQRFKKPDSETTVRWGKEDVFTLPAFREDFGPHRVVLVDTDKRMLYKRFKEFGEGPYNLAAFDAPLEMLHYLEDHPADLLVLQNRMGEISGSALTERVREKHNLLELPVLLLTATGEQQTPLWHAETGVNETLDRSATKEQILSKADSLIQMKKAAEASIQQEISYLHEQITPHFFYNTINTIIGLSYEDGDKAREALENLATYFRRKLGFYSRQVFVPLYQELELVKAYLAIEELRYGARLTVTYEEKGDLSLRVPALILQPLVENAVFHGASKSSKGGHIHIQVDADLKEGVMLTVTDNGPGISLELREKILSGTTGRVGITNIIKKLRLLKNASFHLAEPEGGGTKTTIIMREVTSFESAID